MLKTVFALAPRLSLHVAGAGILAMVSLMFAEIVSTKLFNYSLPYVIEYSEYLVPIIVFWGAAYTLAEKGHVRADILVHHFPGNVRRWILLAGYVLGLIFLIVVFWQLLQVALRSIEMKRYSFYPTPSPIGPPQLFACIGLGLFIFQLLVEIARMGLEIAGRRDPGPEQ
ncbi:MAG: TRAP transporter small permease [Rhodobacter sp.]|nr:TRAP transporter small permease [Rhodobacter sp.]